MRHRLSLSRKFLVILASVLFLSVSLTILYPVQQHEIKQEQAEDDKESPDLASNQSINAFTLFMKTIGLIVLFTVVLYFGLRAYKNFIYSKGANGHAAQIKVLGTTIIGPKKNLCIVNALDHILLLGLAENQITLLMDIPTTDLNENLREALLNGKGSIDPNFKKVLKSWMKK